MSSSRYALCMSYVSLIICFCLFASYPVFGHGHGHSHEAGGHGHSHGEHDESPSFKYTQQANKPRHHHGHSHHAGDDQDQEHVHDGHDHFHHHHHASHEDHGHSHEDHGHGHSHEDHGHGHSHEDHGHGHSHEDHGMYEDRGHSHEHHNDRKLTIDEDATKKDRESGPSVWLWAIGSTVLISALPVVLLLVIPIDGSQSHQPLLKVLLGFAAGGLLGDAFLHLIPHSVSPHQVQADGHQHSHSHDHGEEKETHSHSHDLGVGLWILLGIVIFLALDKMVRLANRGNGHGHSHSHVHTDNKPKKEEVSDKEKTEESTHKTEKHEKTGDGGRKNQNEVAEKQKEPAADPRGNMQVAAYLNMVADFVHNFTDGLTIGASYLAGQKVGMLTTFFILIHEAPHEIGDFAILIQSGCSKKKAILLQLGTAVGAVFGTVCSLLLEGASGAATSWILPFTAGGFIYIALVVVCPELLKESKPRQSFCEILALLAGILIMVAISLNE